MQAAYTGRSRAASLQATLVGRANFCVACSFRQPVVRYDRSDTSYHVFFLLTRFMIILPRVLK